MVVEVPPSDALAPWVECFWYRAASTSPRPISHRVLPDGAADILIDVGAATASAIGTMTRPLLLHSTATPELLGVRFHPGRALPFLRMPLSAVTDDSAPLMRLRDTADAIANIPTLPARVTAFESLLLAALARDVDVDRRVDAAVARIVGSDGRIAIDALADDIGISRQHLSRRFLAHVGVTPKTFARVIRFRALLRRARQLPDRDWSALAADGGYFDQSHLIADFQQFAGTTPVPFFLSPADADR
jgi:AraC-like DNA-binding protein